MQETWIDLNMGNSKYTVFAVWIPDVFRHISVESYIFNSDEVLNPKVDSNYWNRILLNCIKNNLIYFALYTHALERSICEYTNSENALMIVM